MISLCVFITSDLKNKLMRFGHIFNVMYIYIMYIYIYVYLYICILYLFYFLFYRKFGHVSYVNGRLSK
jgi:hypothetical protein